MFQQFLHLNSQKPLELRFYIFIAIFIAGIGLPAHAVPFNTSYVSLDIPKNWTCASENVNWICFNKLNKKLAQEAVIILTAKEVGPQDNLPEYLRHLKQKKVYTRRGKQVVSKILHAKQRMIARHSWIDGFHLASEIPNYYTRYLASTKKNLGVLVTYSAGKQHWKKYANDFNKSIQSLRLLSVDEALRKIRERNRSGQGGRSIKDYLEAIIGDGGDSVDSGSGSEGGFFADNMNTVLGGGVGAGVGGWFLWRLLGRKKRSSSRQPSSSRRRRRR